MLSFYIVIMVLWIFVDHDTRLFAMIIYLTLLWANEPIQGLACHIEATVFSEPGCYTCTRVPARNELSLCVLCVGWGPRVIEGLRPAKTSSSGDDKLNSEAITQVAGPRLGASVGVMGLGVPSIMPWRVGPRPTRVARQ